MTSERRHGGERRHVASGYVEALQRDARHGGDLLEQAEAGEECEHGRMPWDPSPGCGCWPTSGRRPQLQLMPVEDTEVDRRIQWLRHTYLTKPAMSYRAAADAYHREFGVPMTASQARNLIASDRRRDHRTLTALGLAA